MNLKEQFAIVRSELYREYNERNTRARDALDTIEQRVAALKELCNEMAITFRNYYAQAISRHEVDRILERAVAILADGGKAV